MPSLSILKEELISRNSAVKWGRFTAWSSRM